MIQLSLGIVILKHIFGYTLEINHIHVVNVIKFSQGIVILKDMREHTLGRNHINAVVWQGFDNS